MRKNLCTLTAVAAFLLLGASGAVAADAPAVEPPIGEAWLAAVVATDAGMSVASPALQEEGQEPLFLGHSEDHQAPAEQCGLVRCPPGTECCNASCGICVEPGGVCIQIVCEHPGDQNNPN